MNCRKRPRSKVLQNVCYEFYATTYTLKLTTIKVVEDLLVKKKSSNNADVNKKELETSRMLKRNLTVLKKQAEKEGISVSELIKMLKSE